MGGNILSLKEEILKNSGFGPCSKNKKKSKGTPDKDGKGPKGRGKGPGKGKADGSGKKDIYMSKDTDYTCKYCGEKFDTEKALDKHQRGCK